MQVRVDYIQCKISHSW